MILAVTPDQVLYGYGPLGVGVVVLTYALVKLFNIIMQDRNKAVEDRDTMTQDVFTKVLPAFARNTEVLERRQELDRELIDVLKESNKQLEANTKAFEEFKYTWNSGQGNNRVGGP